MTRFEVPRRQLLLLGFGLCAAPLGCKPDAAQAEALPRLGRLQSFQLTNQEGEAVSEQTLRGSVWVAAFLFTRCPTVCPKIMKQLTRMQRTAKDKQIPVKFVCFSVDPEFDTPKVLKAYGERYGVDFSRWWFLTGDSQTIQKTVTDSFKVGLEGSIDEDKEHLGITHGSHLVLVDADLTIRGYYRSSEEAKTRELLLHAAQLAKA